MTDRKPRAASKSYVIACAVPFRDAVTGLASRRKASVADLARAVLLLVGPDSVVQHDDPGEPAAGERESVVLKSGALKDRTLKRKPRLQARLPAGLDPAAIRKALAIALELDRGGLELSVARAGSAAEAARRLEHAAAEGKRLEGLLASLRFEPLAHGVRSRAEALFVLGFPPGAHPDAKTLRERFRQLARVHHPDGPYGDHRRMSQLNQAMALLQSGR